MYLNTPDFDNTSLASEDLNTFRTSTGIVDQIQEDEIINEILIYGENYVLDNLSLPNFGRPQEQCEHYLHTREQELDVVEHVSQDGTTAMKRSDPTNGYTNINSSIYEADAIPLPSSNSIDKTSKNIHILIKVNV